MKKKLFRKSMAMILAFVMILTLLPGMVMAEENNGVRKNDDAQQNEKAELQTANEDFSYYVLENDTAEITGYTGSASELDVPNEIDGYTVTGIGDGAFFENVNLTDVTIPDSVTYIGHGAFFECSGLKNITFPESLTSIGESAFDGCTGLKEIEIPANVTSIGDWAFWACESLESITVDAGNAVYDSREDCNAIIEKETAALIAGCRSTVIPNNVKVIGKGAFAGCSGLTNIKIPDSVTDIEDYAFLSCSDLTEITIPGKVASIGEWAFLGCFSLDSIAVDESNTVYDSRENCNAVIETDTNTLIIGCNNTVIPEGVLKIDPVAVAGCEGLKSITIPESLTSIEGDEFLGCVSLESIVIDPENKVYDSREDCNAIIETGSDTLIIGCKNTVIPKSVKNIGEGAFAGCSGLTSITIPENITGIGDYAFIFCEDLTEVVFPESLSGIGRYEFWGCTKLTSVTIPESVTVIGEGAFSECGSLADVYYKGSEDGRNSLNIGDDNDNLLGAAWHYAKDSSTKKTSISTCTVASIKAQTYTGSAIKPTITVKNGSTELKEGTDYSVTYSNNKNVGKAQVTIKGKGSYTGTKKVTFKIVKAANPLRLEVTEITFLRSDLTKKQTFSVGAVGAAGKVTYTLSKKAVKAKIKVTGNGQVTIPKNCANGTYTITVKAKGNKNYKAAKETVTMRIVTNATKKNVNNKESAEKVAYTIENPESTYIVGADKNNGAEYTFTLTDGTVYTTGTPTGGQKQYTAGTVLNNVQSYTITDAPRPSDFPPSNDRFYMVDTSLRRGNYSIAKDYEELNCRMHVGWGRWNTNRLRRHPKKGTATDYIDNINAGRASNAGYKDWFIGSCYEYRMFTDNSEAIRGIEFWTSTEHDPGVRNNLMYCRMYYYKYDNYYWWFKSNECSLLPMRSF